MIDNIKKDILLSEYTTIGLGGYADYFIECNSEEDIINAISYAKSNKQRYHILGGGSNTVFSDNGFKGIVIYINTKGISDDGNGNFIVKAGVEWDTFVEYTVKKGYSGIECLSGIPGNTGAAPIQNIGAYGQEASESIISVKVIDTENMETMTLDNRQCNFSYRNSMFKAHNSKRYVITDVIFRLDKSGNPEIRYKELSDYLGTYGEYNSFNNNKDRLLFIRNAVLDIRRRKSMVFDLNDPDSKSCGSFFTNPVLSSIGYLKFIDLCNRLNLNPVSYKYFDKFKISAAWLIENAGFAKGITEDGIGISSKHTLALVNRGGTTESLMKFSEKIVKTVFEKFGVVLTVEPEIV